MLQIRMDDPMVMHTPYQIVKRIKKNPRDGGILGKLGQRHAIDKFEDESVFVYDFVQFRDTGETEKLLVDFALSGEEPPSEKKTVKKVLLKPSSQGCFSSIGLMRSIRELFILYRTIISVLTC